MVYRHGSKYNTNKSISKNMKPVVDRQIVDREFFNSMDASKSINYAWGKNVGVKFSGKEGPQYRFYTDNTEYEHIDKKERKKLYKKTQEKDLDSVNETAEEEENFAPISTRKTYKLFRMKDAELPEAPTREKARKLKDRENAKKNLRVYRFEGNINHAVNQVEVPDLIAVPQKRLKKHIVKNAGKKNCLYNGDYSVYKPHDHYKDKALGRSNKKRTNDVLIKGDLEKYEEFVMIK
jgi:hypothetical protein